MALFNPDATASSPSVSLERGRYRMRAPPLRPPPFALTGKPAPVTQHRANRNVVLLLLVLALACMSCFASAYYLFSTRWALPPVRPLRFRADSGSQVDGYDAAVQRPQKYLAYLPHSGFHNQRIALENALVLSRLLHRTLLVPPVHLGNRPIRYVDFETLSRLQELSGKEGLLHCPSVPVYLSRPPECLGYFESSYMPWNWFVNLSAIAESPSFQRPNMSLAWVRAKFDIDISDIYALEDALPYSFRFVDTLEVDVPPGSKYLNDIGIAELATVNQSLLQLGTLFGSSRLRLRDPRNIAIRQSIRQSMVLVNSGLALVADSIARFLDYAYLGLHLRSGDGKFEQNVLVIAEAAWCQVMQDALGFSESKVLELSRALSYPVTCSNSIRRPPQAAPLLPNTFRGECRTPRYPDGPYESLNIPLYVATDLKDAEVNPSLLIFRETFPCLFFLQDFKREIASVAKSRSPYDGVSIDPFLLPFIDALVVGQALRFIGTEGSTFSKFIKEILRARQLELGLA